MSSCHFVNGKFNVVTVDMSNHLQVIVSSVVVSTDRNIFVFIEFYSTNTRTYVHVYSFDLSIRVNAYLYKLIYVIKEIHDKTLCMCNTIINTAQTKKSRKMKK